jgi:hypothetical protein
MKRTNEEIVRQLCEIITKSNLASNNIVSVLADFQFSIGSSLENCKPSTSEEVLLRYAQNPTLGNALMASAIQMKETWKG